jgi:hypothetical protein
LLVGVEPSSPLEATEVDILNREIASLARDFFVSSQETPREIEYGALVGTAPDALSGLDFDAMARDSLRREFGDPKAGA